MSRIDQPLLIANSNYHVGQQMSIRVAEELGYFKEEGFTDYLYEHRGLIPGPLEPEALSTVMEHAGVDIATAVDVGSALSQRIKGADLYIVGGWRYPPNLKVIGSHSIQNLVDLRGHRLGTREPGGLAQRIVVDALQKQGVDALNECEWVYDPIFAYGNSAKQVEMLKSEEIQAITTQPPTTEILLREGFPILLDPLVEYPFGRPDKVIVATGRVVEQRNEELRQFLKGNIRGFWGMRNPLMYDYLVDLEERLRAVSHNDQEQSLQIISSIEKVEGWNAPVTGGLSIERGRSREALQNVIDEMTQLGQLEGPIGVDDVLRIREVEDALTELVDRKELQDDWLRAQEAVAKYGF